MKAKKIVALVMSAAMVAGAASMLAACKKNPDNGGGNTTIPYVEDTNSYYAVGAGKGDATTHGTLYKQGTMIAGGVEDGWNPKSDDIPFTKDTTIEDENVYTLTLTMYAGDAFKILYDKDAGWGGEAINFFSLEADYIEGDAAEATYTVEGETWFVTNGDSNIICNEDQDGVYKFTLKTYPEAETKYVISVEKDHSIDRLRIPYKMRVLGDFNRYGIYTGGEMTSKTVGTNVIWSTTIKIEAEDLTLDSTGAEAATGATHSAIYVSNIGDGEGKENEKMEFVEGEGVTVGDNTVNLLEEGKYNVTFNQTTKAVTITKIEEEMQFVLGGKTGAMLTYEDGVWKGTLNLTESTVVKLHDINGYVTADVAVGETALAAGEWEIRYTRATNTVEFADWAWYLVGDYTNPAWSASKDNEDQLVRLTETEPGSGVYSGEVTFTTVPAQGFKAAKANILSGINWDSNGGQNQNVTATGTYIISYKPADGDAGYTITLKPTQP